MFSFFKKDMPVLDVEKMCEEIAKKTGIEHHTVCKIIDAETVYMIQKGLVEEEDDEMVKPHIKMS
jgi:hypothetical protein